MIIKEVIATRRFSKEFNNLDEDIKDAVREIIKALEYGEKVRGTFYCVLKWDLKNYVSIHFCNNEYRLVYQETKNKLKIFLLSW